MLNKTHSILLFFILTCSTSVFAQFQLKSIVSNKPVARLAETTADTIPIPFWDDFSSIDYLNPNSQPDTYKWLNAENVFINPTLGINPPSINVATFDGTKANSMPYSADANAKGLTDELQSKPIDLSNITISDSLYFSFFWQMQGNGERPNEAYREQDSLVLQFQRKDNDSTYTWVNVWSQLASDSVEFINGNDTTTRLFRIDTFQQVLIKIETDNYLYKGFQFRFASYGRQSGPFDMWHVDYIYLDINRTNNTAHDDRAITTIPSSIFKDFSAIPITQILNDANNFNGMATVGFYNLNDQAQPAPAAAYVNIKSFIIETTIDSSYQQNDSSIFLSIDTIDVTTEIMKVDTIRHYDVILSEQVSNNNPQAFERLTIDSEPVNIAELITSIYDNDTCATQDCYEEILALYREKNYSLTFETVFFINSGDLSAINRTDTTDSNITYLSVDTSKPTFDTTDSVTEYFLIDTIVNNSDTTYIESYDFELTDTITIMTAMDSIKTDSIYIPISTITYFKKVNDYYLIIDSTYTPTDSITYLYQMDTILTDNISIDKDTSYVMASAPYNYRDTLFEISHTSYVTSTVYDLHHRRNDTVSAIFTIGDYYAYDDGTAEVAAGINQRGGYLAYQYVLDVEDTISAVDIYFPNTGGDNNGSYLEVYIWSNSNNKPDTVILASYDHNVVFGEMNDFIRYYLDEPIAVNDTIYIGFKQNVDELLGVGFDINTNTGDKIYYNTGGSWLRNNILDGSLMIRPVFEKIIPAPLTITGTETEQNKAIIYPNPSEGTFYVYGDFAAINLYNIIGTEVEIIKTDEEGQIKIQTKHTPEGIYILLLTRHDGSRESHKIILK